MLFLNGPTPHRVKEIVMTSPSPFPLRYVLPTRAVTLRASVRLAVEVDPAGGHLEPEIAVAIALPGRPPASSVRRAGAAARPAPSPDGALRRAFDRTHPHTAALVADLSSRSEQFLAGLTMSEDPADVVVFGRALEVVHRELAAADRMRREWIARQGHELRSGEWDLTASDLVPLATPLAQLPAETAVPDALGAVLARDFGLLVALCADESDDAHRGAHAVLAVYRRTPAVLAEPADAVDAEPWVLDCALSRLHLADALTDDADGRPVAIPSPRSAPDDAATLSDAARRQLGLLDASDEYARLAATHHRTEELAALRREHGLSS